MWTQLVVSRLNQRLINTIFSLHGKLQIVSVSYFMCQRSSARFLIGLSFVGHKYHVHEKIKLKINKSAAFSSGPQSKQTL